MELALPEPVRAALREHDIAPSGPLGVGAVGLRWSALGPDGRRYAVVHASGALAPAVRARAQALAMLRHPSLAHCAEIIEAQGGVVVLVEAAPGTDLAVLLEARGRFTAGEVVGLLAPVGEALAVLHAAGLAHGDVAPANIVVTEGRPVLVDLLGAVDSAEGGTSGFVPAGREHGPSPAADVASLGLVAIALLGGTDAAVVQGAAADAWSSAAAGSEAERSAVLGVASRATSTVECRPDARELAAELRRACAPAPLQPADPAVLARLGLRRLSGVHDGALRASVTVRGTPPARGEGRHRATTPRARRAGARGWVARGAALGLAAAVIALTLVLGPETAAHAAVRLTRERAQALVAGDAAALAAVTVPGSVAARADHAALAERASVPEVGGDSGSWDLDVAAEGTRTCGAAYRCVTVRTVTVHDGVRSAPRRVVLVLEREPWRVLEVRLAG